jgi:hypothetical protein
MEQTNRPYCIDQRACFVEILRQLLDYEFLCVTDAEKMIGVITKGDVDRYLRENIGGKDITAADICNKAFAYTTLEKVDFDRDKLNRFKYLPLLDRDGKLLYILRSKSSAQEWESAQEYEIAYWRKWLSLKDNASYKYLFMPSHRYIDDENITELLQKQSAGKVCLEIGAGGLYGFLPGLKRASKRIMIEPLADKYKDLRRELNIDLSDIEDVISYPVAADCYMQELEGSVDGLIICQNALDHTPNWPFILNNISSYAAKGCHFYLWTDIDHGGEVEGHFNIAQNPLKMFQMIENLGFDLIYKKVQVPFGNLNICCVGVKCR